MRVMEKKFEIYKDLFGAFLKKIPSDELMQKYFNHSEEGDKYDDDGFTAMQDFVCNNLKPEFNWSTGIGIIEGVEHIVEEAFINGNIKRDTWKSRYYKARK
jgi:hypothetical protein